MFVLIQNVCINTTGSENCSTCWKCARTLVTLEVIGELDKYKEAFDMEKYWRNRNKYIGKILSSKHPLSREIVQQAKELKYKFPLMSKCYSLAYTPLAIWESREVKGTIPYRIRRILKNLKLTKK